MDTLLFFIEAAAFTGAALCVFLLLAGVGAKKE
jgi:hypothetical protein